MHDFTPSRILRGSFCVRGVNLAWLGSARGVNLTGSAFRASYPACGIREVELKNYLTHTSTKYADWCTARRRAGTGCNNCGRDERRVGAGCAEEELVLAVRKKSWYWLWGRRVGTGCKEGELVLVVRKESWYWL